MATSYGTYGGMKESIADAFLLSGLGVRKETDADGKHVISQTSIHIATNDAVK